MSQDWYLMKPDVLGGFENEEFGLWRGAFKNSILTTDFARTVDIYGNYPTNEPRRIRALVLDQVENSYNKMKERQILTELGEIQCGDLLLIDGRWWLVISLVDQNRLYSKGILYYCNSWLNFTSLKTFETVRYPVVVHNATQYNSGERSTDYMVTVSSQRLYYFPANEETILFDNDYRFLHDRNTLHPSAWKIAQVDTENDNWDGYGIVRIMAVEDELLLTDDTENMIADNSKWIEKHGVNQGYPSVEDIPASDGGGWIDMA